MRGGYHTHLKWLTYVLVNLTSIQRKVCVHTNRMFNTYKYHLGRVPPF